MRDTKGDESGERRLRDAAEAEEADGAAGRGSRCTQLWPTEGEGAPVEFRPLGTLVAEFREVKITYFAGLDQGVRGAVVAAGHEGEHDGEVGN